MNIVEMEIREMDGKFEQKNKGGIAGFGVRQVLERGKSLLVHPPTAESYILFGISNGSNPLVPPIQHMPESIS